MKDSKNKALAIRDKIRDNRIRRKDERSEASIPKITTENVAEHREDVLSGARKYIYPLQHSKHKIVLLSTSLFLLAVFLFSVLSVLFLYRFQTTSSLMYQITKVIPFPIARSSGTFISYENYLFELEHYIHYYENQQELSFESEFGKAQLDSYKKRALDKVINDAYIKMVATEKGISVTPLEVDEQIRIAREQNRLGSSEKVLEDVLKDFWNWSISDYRRSLTSEILKQKVLRALDTDAENKATAALARVKIGEDFAVVAKELSADEATKENGGDFGFVDKSNRNVSQQTVDTLFSLQPGQVSNVTVVPYGTGYALSIIKKIEEKGEQVRGAYIIIPITDADVALNDLKEQKPYRLYIDPVEIDTSTGI